MCLTNLSDEGLFDERSPPETSPARTKSAAIVPATAQIDAETSAGSDL